MYTDPNVGGMLFQAFAAVLTLAGILFAILQRVRPRAMRVRIPVRNSKNKRK